MADQKQLQAFLLGTCDDATAAGFEELLFTDDAFLDELRRAETSLFEQRAAGTLAPKLQEQLQLQADRSPAFRAKLENARARYAHSQADRDSAGDRFWMKWGARRPVATSALAVVALLLVAGLFFSRQFPSAASDHAQKHEASVPPRMLAPELKQTIPGHPDSTSAPANAAGAEATVFLPQMVLRGTGAFPVIHVNQGVAAIHVEVEVHAAANLRSGWSCALFHRNKRLQQWENLEVQSEGDIRYLSFVVSAGGLSPGTYELRLTSPESMNGPALQVSRPFTVSFQ